MESKHTPGPWMDDAMNKHRQIRISAKATRTSTYVVALVEPDCPDDLTQEANAQLIAAAPDLLEALKGVMEYAEIEVVQRRHLIDSDEEAAEVEDAQKKIAAAVAAIAKATGGDK